MTGVLFILYFGQKNVLGTGWSTWTIASFTTFLACFVKLSVKSSSAAKLFNAVHKAQISWKRIKPLLTKQEEIPKSEKNVSGILENGKVEKIENVSAKHAEDLKIMMTFYPQDTARSFFNADYMMTYPYNMKGKACQGVYSRTRVVVIERNGLDVFFYFTMTDVGIKDFDKYLMDLKGVLGFNAMTRQDGH